MNWIIVGLLALVALLAVATFLAGAYLRVHRDRHPILTPIGVMLDLAFNITMGFVVGVLAFQHFPGVGLITITAIVVCVIVLLVVSMIRGFDAGRKYLEERGAL